MPRRKERPQPAPTYYLDWMKEDADNNFERWEQLAGPTDYNRDRRELYINFFNNYDIHKKNKITEACTDHHTGGGRSGQDID